MNESDMLSEEQFDNAAVLSVKSCLGDGLESLFALIDSHRALSALLAAERERRERAEEALRSFPNNHIQDGCIVIACPVCDYFSNYGSEG